jgi:hypothetical protein
MKTTVTNRKQNEEGSILGYFIMAMVFAAIIADVGAYVVQTVNIAHRRNDMISAGQYAQGGVAIACTDLNAAFLNKTAGGFRDNLIRSFSYTPVSSNSTAAVYQRTISSPFTNQTVTAQIWLDDASPDTAKVVVAAKVGEVTQTYTLNTFFKWGYPGAIISVNNGTTANGVAKGNAQDGNVVIDGSASGPLVVDGNIGYAAIANGRVNVATQFTAVSPGSISMTNGSTSDPIPDFTSQGTTNSLFDFNRFIAVADLTPNTYNTNSHNNHFSTVLSIADAIKKKPDHTLEGVVVVDIRKTDKNYGSAGDIKMFPYGINVRGTLFYNFGPEFGPLDKFVVTCDMNINPADLSNMVATNPATYTSGYPPVYSDPSKNPIKIDITSKHFDNFTKNEDLPALMYSIGEVDIHGNANVCGVCYTPSYMEIEEKYSAGQTQYFKGTLIMGDGIYLENNNRCTTVISYDAAALDNLATLFHKGKKLVAGYWE